MNIKVLIASLFVITVISAVAGVAVYYQSLGPLRLVAQCTGVDSVLDKVTYMEYNITDFQDNEYLVKLWNDPATRSGRAEMYVNGNLSLKIEYRYSARLEAITLYYANGTNETYEGLNASLYEEPFYTSLKFDYNQTTGAAAAEPFPGVAPIYLLCYVGRANDIDWNYYASLVKPRNQPLGPVDVIVNFGKTTYKGEEINAVLLQISRIGTVQNKWTLPVYTASVADIGGVPAAVTLTVEIPTQEGGNRFTFHLLDLQTTG